MEISKKVVLYSVGIVFLMAFVFIGVMVYSKGEGSTTSTMAKYDSFLEQFGNVELVMFDNGTASGSDVLKLISGLDADSGYTISVTNGESDTEVVYTAAGVDSLSLSEAVARAKKKTEKDYYINANASFTSVIEKDGNGVVTQVTFVQVK